MGTVSEGTKTERFSFIDRHRLAFGLRYLCDRLGVTRQGYYKWKSPELSRRDRDNAQIGGLIRDIFDEHKGNYGSPRIHAELRRRGYPINRKRVARLMSQMALIGKAGRLYRRKPLPENRCIKVANLVRELGPPDRKPPPIELTPTFRKKAGGYKLKGSKPFSRFRGGNRRLMIDDKR